MPLKFYLEKRLNKHGEAPIRAVWSFNGDRFQTTVGFSIPPRAWDDKASRVSPVPSNHKGEMATFMNAFIEALEKAVSRAEYFSRLYHVPLNKPTVNKVVADVLAAGGEYPSTQESVWRRMVKERGRPTDRYFEHYMGGKYKLIAIAKDTDTLENVVVYQEMFGDHQIWIRPMSVFFGKEKMADGTVVDLYKEI